jgi:hypothetical protein
MPPLDKDVVNLAKAIRQVESGNRTVTPQEGSGFGGASRYQYSHDTWKEVARKYLGDEKAPLTLENENKATYYRIKDWKDQGKKPAQIASMWNAGPNEPDAYTGFFSNGKPSVGENRYGVKYDVPGHANKVRAEYEKIKMGGQAAPIGATQFQTSGQPTPATQTGGFLSQLQTQPMEPPKPPSQLDYRLNQAGEALGTLSEGIVNKNPLQVGSGLLQTGGAAAGGFLDATDAAIKAVPVLGTAVEGLEKGVGAIAGKALDTELGQAAVEKYQSLPESWQKNIGAAGNIAAAVPVLRGLKGAFGGIKNKVGDVVKGAPETVAKKELEGVVSRVIKGGSTLKASKGRGLDPLAVILREAPPTLKKDAKGIDRYDGSQSYDILSQQVSKLDDQLDAVLEEATRKVPGYKGYWDLVDIKEDVARELKKEFRGSPELKGALKELDTDFDSIIESLDGGRVSLGDMNLVKRKVRDSVKWDSPQIKQDVAYHTGQVLMKRIEELADQRGFSGVKELNKQMAERLEAQKILQKYIDNKSVTNTPGLQGFISRQGEMAATAGGEAAGQSLGMPYLGGLVGRAIFNKSAQGKPSALQRLNQVRKPTKKQDLLLPPAALVANQSAQQEQQRRQQERQR